MASRPVAGLLLALALLPMAGCTQPGPQAVTDPPVLATFYPLAFLAERIASPDLAVTTLVPAGIEPHDWEPRPSDRVRMERAKVFAYLGAGFEPWLDAVAPDLRARGVLLVEASQGVPLQQAAAREEGGDQAGADPHVWLDPVRAQALAANLAAGIQRADPANASAHAGRAEALREGLASLDAAFREGLATCANRNILTTHAAFGYLAGRYDFTQWSISGIDPEAEPPPGRVRDMVDLARRLNITHVFFETLVSPRVAEVIAQEVGAQTLVLDPIEGIPPEQRAAGKDYLTLMRANLANLRLAMGCA